MRRWWVWLAAIWIVVSMVPVIFYGLAGWQAMEFYQHLEAGREAGLKERVDFPALRLSLQKQVEAKGPEMMARYAATHLAALGLVDGERIVACLVRRGSRVLIERLVTPGALIGFYRGDAKELGGRVDFQALRDELENTVSECVSDERQAQILLGILRPLLNAFVTPECLVAMGSGDSPPSLGFRVLGWNRLGLQVGSVEGEQTLVVFEAPGLSWVLSDIRLP